MSTSKMAPRRSKGKHIPRSSGEGLRSVPNDQTQALYNTFRKLEDLQAETPCPSPISSVTRATGDMEIGDERPPTKKQKAQRTGPLDAVQRARAAFMRVIGACVDCKARKVPCTHFDRKQFERNYQASKPFGPTLQVDRARRAPTPSESIPPSRSWATVSQSHYEDLPAEGPPTPLGPVPDQAPNGLVHTGSWHTTHHVENWAEEAGDMAENLSGEAPLTLQTGFLATLGIPESAPLFPYERPASQTFPASWTSQGEALQGGIQNFVDHDDNPRDNPSSREDEDIVAIAQKLDISGWECKHGVDANPPPGVEARACGEIFPSLPDAITHFATNHAPISENWSTWRCRSLVVRDRVLCCDTLVPTAWGDPSMGVRCPVCDGYRWQLWQYGSISKRPVSTQDASARVLSRDDALLGGKWGSLNQPSPNGFPDTATSCGLWLGRDMGSGYCGSQRSQSPLRAAAAHGFHLWSKQRALSTHCGQVASLLLLLFYVSAQAFLCPFGQAFKLGLQHMETGRDAIFWGSLSCLVGGGLLTWLLKSIQPWPGRPTYPGALDISRYRAVPLGSRAVGEDVC